MTKSSATDQYRTISVEINWKTCEPLEELEWLLRRCRSPSFDPWTHRVSLELVEATITRPMVHSMIDLLDLPFAKDPSGVSHKEFRWISIRMRYDCKFAQPHIAGIDAQDYCTLDDILRLFVAMTQSVWKIHILFCPQILDAFLSSDHQLYTIAADDLAIVSWDALSARQYAKLGDMIQRSVSLRCLCLRLPFVDEARELFAGLVNVINIQELSFQDTRQYDRERNNLFLSDLVVGKNGNNGPIMKILQNPQNSLKKLNLGSIDLQDRHVTAILQAISKDHIEDLDFSNNRINVQGMSEFADLLPKMTSLLYFAFEYNDLEHPSTDRNKVGEALLQGIMDNTSICDMSGIECLPQYAQLWHYLAVNSAGRRILTSSEPIAAGLWPLVLKRAQKPFVYRYYLSREAAEAKKYNVKANAVYFFLQNIVPRIVSSHITIHNRPNSAA